MNYKEFQVEYKTALGKKKLVYVRGRNKKEAKENFNKKYPIQKITEIKEMNLR